MLLLLLSPCLYRSIMYRETDIASLVRYCINKGRETTGWCRLVRLVSSCDVGLLCEAARRSLSSVCNCLRKAGGGTSKRHEASRTQPQKHLRKVTNPVWLSSRATLLLILYLKVTNRQNVCMKFNSSFQITYVRKSSCLERSAGLQYCCGLKIAAKIQAQGLVPD